MVIYCLLNVEYHKEKVIRRRISKQEMTSSQLRDIYIPYADADVEIIAFKIKFPSQLTLTFKVYM
jgi:hypothetical protein